MATRLPAGLRLEPQTARQLLVDEVLARFDVHDLPITAQRAFVEAIASQGVAGGRTDDAHIAEIARLAGAAVLVSGNHCHFASLVRHGLRVRRPDEFVSLRDADARRGD